MAFDANDLTPHEHFVLERIRLGEVADFTALGAGGPKPSLRAGFIRKLLLGLDPAWAVQAPGVRIKGARIEGELDLSGCSGSGDKGLPALRFDACDIPERMNFSGARLAQLCLRQCAFTHLVAHAIVVDGVFDFSEAHAPSEGGACWIDARGAKIAGRVEGGGAKLRIEDGQAREDGVQKFALVLREARVSGGVALRPDFRAIGGVSLFDAVVDGLVDMRGAHLKAVDRRALDLGNLRATGLVAINRGFRCEGPVWMRGAVLLGGFNANGATISVKDGEREGVNAENCEIHEDLQMRSKFACNGPVNFAGAVVNGSVHIDEATFSAAPLALDFSKAEIDGEFAGAATLNGALKLAGAKIGRNLDLRSTEIGARVVTRTETLDHAIDAASISVGGAALFNGANIKGELFLPDARIDGYLSFGGGRFINAGGWAIRAPNMRAGGNVTLKIEDGDKAPFGVKTVIEGGAKFDRAQIAGAFAWLNLELRGPGPNGDKAPVLSFADARIGGALSAKGLAMPPDGRINAAGAHVASLDDDIDAGWGSASAALALDGFAYERIDSSNDGWRRRLKWLRRSQRASKPFSPQPFAHAARVYARMGRREDARRISLAQHDAQAFAAAGTSPISWPLSSLFGLVAGYGLAPIRVVRALVVFLALGVAGVFAMNEQGALVTPQGAACNGAVEPALYALDVALPVIDLGQESRCGPGRTARADLGQGVALGETDWRLFEGAALWKWAHALYAMLGAILTALAVITFSGALKPRDE
ncbi:MAG: hypothetical protein K2P58_11405 [Hyphomonadaceae bacterium]|nr:hypothetical protein [Hyphomonadaceae bacterium]